LNKEKVRKIIDDFRKALETEGIICNKIFLFGSFAKDTATEESDIDLAVISESFNDMDFWERNKVVSKAIVKIFQPIEVKAYSLKEWEKSKSNFENIVGENEVIYSA
jgi:hypothetical protein